MLTKKLRLAMLAAFICSICACSPRDFLTRRLAADLIAGSDVFKASQQLDLRMGAVSSQDYSSPEYLVLQRKGWITGTNVRCAPSPGTRVTGPPACWDVVLTPLGVEAFHDLIPSSAVNSQSFSVPVARRELIAVTGISKDSNLADVEFQWKWVPLNEVGAALYAGGVLYNSAVTFKHYDDGWRLVEGSSSKGNQGLDDALKNAEPAP